MIKPPNIGAILEVVVTAAITARLISKNKPIRGRDVIDVLNNQGLYRSGVIEFDSPTSDDTAFNAVEMSIETTIDVKNYLKLQSNRNTAIVIKLANSAAAYVNRSAVSRTAKILYNDTKFNLIQVQNHGTSWAKNTKDQIEKVDVKVFISDDRNGLNRRQTDINLSIKAGAKQVGQFGSTYASIQKPYELLGLELSTLDETRFNAARVDDIYKLYVDLFKRITDHINYTPLGSTIDVLNFIKFYSSGTSDDVEFLSITKFGTIHNVKNLSASLEHKMKGKYTHAKLDVSTEGLPIIRIFIYNKKPNMQHIFSLRCKKSKNKISNIVELEKI